MDVSDIFKTDASDTAPPESSPAEPAELAAPDESTISPVERIRAFRDGTLQFPDISTDTESSDDTETPPPDTPSRPEADQPKHDGSPDNDTDDSDIAEENTTPNPLSPALVWIKKKRTPLAIAGALLVAGIAVNIFTPDQTDKEPHKTGDHTPPAASHATPTATLTAGDKAIKPVSADVSPTQCVTGSRPPMDAFNTNPREKKSEKNTAWVCQMPFGAPGTTMTITLPSMSTISEIASVPGFDGKDEGGKDNWPRYRLVSSVIWYFDADPPKQQTFTTKREQQSVKFDKPIYTKTIRLVVLETIEVPRSQVASPTTTSSAPGLFGDLGDWGKSLGGDPQPSLAATPTATSGPSAFAMTAIQVIGHTSR